MEIRENNGHWPTYRNIIGLYSHKSRIQLSVDYSSLTKEIEHLFP